MRDLLDLLPPALQQVFSSSLGVIVLAWIGRMMWHVSEVQQQKRRFWSLHLLWEAFTAVAIAFVADGLAHWLGLDGKPALGVIVFVSYLGPRGVQAAIVRGLNAYTARGGKL